jgi:hypothetical protein
MKIPVWRTLSTIERKCPRFMGTLQEQIWHPQSQWAWPEILFYLMGVGDWFNARNNSELLDEVTTLIIVARGRMRQNIDNS